MPDLLPIAAPNAREIAPPAPPSPWSIDPGRTQELPPDGWGTQTLKAAEIAAPSPASPWSIDPQRTQELSP